MGPFVRNIQFIIVVLLQITVIVMLSIMMTTNFESKLSPKTNYGLKTEDFDRLKDVYGKKNVTVTLVPLCSISIIDSNDALYEKKNVTETLEHEIGHFQIEKLFESTISIRLSDELATEVLDLVHKWQNANASERERIAEEIKRIIKNEPKVKDLIQSFSDLLDDLKEDDANI